VLRNAGAEVIVPARDLARAKAALKGIDVAIEPMDLLDPASIDAFAEKFLASGKPLHILINSAAIMAAPLARDARGYETQFSTNHLGHFQLSTRLWSAQQKAEGARIVSVSSWGHHYSDMVFDDPNFERRPYDPWAGYGQSKTANALFAVEADARGKADGIRAFSLHPGAIVGTGLEKHVSKEALREAGVLDENDRPIIDPSRNLKTVAQGAATSVWCAVSPALAGLGGVYCENVDVAPLITETVAVTGMGDGVRALGANGVMAYAVDRDAAKRLWTLSEDLLG
jgi:NAD(P)-dependent dehydrogenase (short-subunit alcohol dehydrogenase family)